MLYLPPLNSLRSFWLVTQSGGIRAAAEKNNIGHSSLTQQIQKLEGALGVRLFDRSERSLKLTKEAENFAKEIDNAFQIIANATNLLIRNKKNILHIGCSSSIAIKLLIPLVEKFNEEHNLFKVKLITPCTIESIHENNLDGIFSVEKDEEDKFHKNKFLSEELCLISSPNSRHLIDDQQVKLIGIHAPGWYEDWNNFFIRNKKILPTEKIVWVSSPLVAIQAAADGVGISLMTPSLIRDDLQSRRVKKMTHPQHIQLTRDINFYTPKENPRSQSMEIWLDWLSQKASLYLTSGDWL
ncbi:transcriptional regulator [Neokomagataea thailandica NBRC 106555]|uniref:LysR family transcriptional regulator n=2 Tax=Neokomagataea TaxID=1223423 RepID=A0A4Y6V7M2_9PROT|nr:MULTISPECIES: LysR family transcriptional regulator [Neokomagataea]QDH26059.1 LysR family transcriptional regulator [Neokomagataea tanensis]GBR55179.1 transcriptional regulator [Neokomagataea thailandica NBRC 106555]